MIPTANRSHMLARIILPISLLCSFFLACGPDTGHLSEFATALPETVDYNFHIKPILSDRCFACHGPDAAERKAALRLDQPEGGLKQALESGGHAFVSGSLRKSKGFLRMLSDDPEIQMPPPESNLYVSDYEKAVIARWIEQGAEYKPHWAFIAPKKASIPDAHLDWGNNEIDRFVAAKLAEQDLSPAEPADKATLIRRVSFDLTGLPPSLEEIEAFLADTRPDAYEKVVDRLLASPAYGERMAAHWLEVARYADSDGYLDDKHRSFSPWRDWVIRSFNENMPYDQFVTWQLAGDLLPNATQEQILATAFNRLHRKNGEAGIVFEEYRVEYVADRTQTLGRAFMGLTYECARCHDHKYDPISQADYYRAFAFFNNTFEIGTPVYGPDQTPGPSLLLSDAESQAQLAFLQQEIQQTEHAFAQQVEDEPAFQEWLARHPLSISRLQQGIEAAQVAHYPFDRITPGKSLTTPNLANPRKPASVREPILQPGVSGQAFFVSDYNRAVMADKVGWYERTEPFSIDLWLYPDTVYEKAGIFTHCEDIRLGYKGYSLHLEDNRLQFIMAHSWPQNAIQRTTVEALPVKKWTRLTLTYDGSSKANGLRMYLNGQAAELETDFDNLYKGILFEPNIHTYGFSSLQIGQRDKITPFKGGGIDELRVFNRELSPLEVVSLAHPDQASSLISQTESDSSRALIRAHFQATTPSPKQLRKLREQENELVNSIPEIMVMGDAPESRATFVLDRGSYTAPREEVFPGTPAEIFPFPDELPKNRLGLAKSLFLPNHPLTARVIANRIWGLHFGQGIVETVEDFGSQGSLPTHPELLDWLAIYLQESGWDLKALHKYIVLSATYQQSSVMSLELQAQDPDNLLLARGPAFRLPAEMIRDNALAISGLLVHKQGGESVYPYQPAGLWDEISNKHWRYPYLQEPGEGLYRRSIYTVWKRTAPPPSMLIFDAADRGECVVRRRPTSTPLQALVLLNDPQYVEAARVLATDILKHSDPKKDRFELLFRVVLGRMPNSEEKQLVRQLFAEEQARFQANPADARAYLKVGETAWDTSLNTTELAAMAVVAHSLMNTDEAFTKR